MRKDTKQKVALAARGIICVVSLAFLAVFGDFLWGLSSEGELALIGLAIGIVIAIILFLLTIGAIFVAYCPKCKWTPTFRIFLSLFDWFTRDYKYSCPRCKADDVF